jgi:phage anti-repressor protein/phage antirepressor YoqD-like protein
MDPLIKITQTDDGRQAVSGRALHEFLEVSTEYRHWFKRMTAYGFTEGQDYTVIFDRVERPGRGPVERQDHILTMDMAKELSMIQRTDRGREARTYFIECEKRVKEAPALSGPELLARAVLEADTTIKALQASNAELAPAAASWNQLAAPAGDYGVGPAAKVLSRDPNIEIGRDRLFRFMADQGWVFRTKGHRPHWEADQAKGIKTGRLTHKLGAPFLNEKSGEWEQPAPTLRVTPKGLHELHVLLGGSPDGVHAA